MQDLLERAGGAVEAAIAETDSPIDVYGHMASERLVSSSLPPIMFHCLDYLNIMTTYRDITSESEVEAIAVRTGWVTPGTRDAAGVVAYRHQSLPVQLIIRSHFGPEKRRDFYVISFSDPEYLAFFTQDGGWADFGASMGGGLFRMKGLKLEIFLRDCFERDYERYLTAARQPLPFDYVHPWQLEG